jgi:hypothetical protein
MAIVNDGFKATVTLGFKNDRKRTLNYTFVDTITTYDDAVEALTDATTGLLNDLVGTNGVSAAALVSYSVIGKAIQDDYNRPTDADAEGADTAIIVSEIGSDPTKTANVNIPAPKIEIFLATAGVNMDVIDPADVKLLAYMANFQTGGNFTVSDGEQLGAILNGRRTK